MWDKTVAAGGSPVACPLTTNFATLPQAATFLDQIKRFQPGENRMAAGDFEDLSAMLNAGWRHFEHPQPNIETEVELSPSSPYAGRFSLHLRAKTVDAALASGLVESPPLWITSAPVMVQAGELLCIRGRVRMRTAVTGSVDGLLIYDSLAGDALAERIGVTSNWKEFAMYRVAPATGPMTLTFALTGLGDAMLDDVSVKAIARPQVSRLDQASQPPALRPVDQRHCGRLASRFIAGCHWLCQCEVPCSVFGSPLGKP